MIRLVCPTRSLAFAGALIAATIGVPVTGASQAFDPDEIVEMRPVPIQTLVRITRADGNVFYISADKRWMIPGEVIDMWTGEAEHELNGYNQMRWERTGTSLGALKHPTWPEQEDLDGAMFVPHGCADCVKALRELRLKGALKGITPVPFTNGSGGTKWTQIWCQEALTLDILAKWIQNDKKKRQSSCELGEKSGRIRALADVFQIGNEELTVLSRDGRILRGQEEIEQWRDR